MKNRKIFEKQIIDFETGEIKSEASEYVRYNAERFFMGRTTEGLEWLLSFNNLTELVLFVMMLELEQPKNRHIICFTKLQVKESAQILGVSEAMIRKCLAGLVKNDFLRRVTAGNYVANPTTFYKGQSKEVIVKYKEYLRIDKSAE